MRKTNIFQLQSDFKPPQNLNHKSYHKILKACYFVSPLTTTLVLLTLISQLPPVLRRGRFKGRQSGRKCGDVDESMSDHGRSLTCSQQLLVLPQKGGTTTYYDILLEIGRGKSIWKKVVPLNCSYFCLLFLSKIKLRNFIDSP